MSLTIGITGTRDGCTPAQRQTLEALLHRFRTVNGAVWLHHGDCVGVDDEAGRHWHYVLDGKVKVWPPVDERLRAFSPHDEDEPAQTHFARNRSIVDACGVLIACPREMKRQERGGTWYTVDYARKRGRWLTIVRPDGTRSVAG